jgi:hypothetical protein
MKNSIFFPFSKNFNFCEFWLPQKKNEISKIEILQKIPNFPTESKKEKSKICEKEWNSTIRENRFKQIGKNEKFEIRNLFFYKDKCGFGLLLKSKGKYYYYITIILYTGC